MTRKREVAHCQRIHAQKLEAIRSRKRGTGTLDNRLPETAKMKHLKLKLKKLAYTCDDLDAFACNHLGHDLIQEVQS